MRYQLFAVALCLAVLLIAAGATATAVADRAHYETREVDRSLSFAASNCGGSDTVKQRVRVRGKSFRLVDPRVGERLSDGRWYPPDANPSMADDDLYPVVRVERAGLSRDRQGRFVRVTVRGLPERCDSEVTGCDQASQVQLCPRPEWGWRIEVPITLRYRKRIPTDHLVFQQILDRYVAAQETIPLHGLPAERGRPRLPVRPAQHSLARMGRPHGDG